MSDSTTEAQNSGNLARARGDLNSIRLKLTEVINDVRTPEKSLNEARSYLRDIDSLLNSDEALENFVDGYGLSVEYIYSIKNIAKNIINGNENQAKLISVSSVTKEDPSKSSKEKDEEFEWAEELLSKGYVDPETLKEYGNSLFQLCFPGLFDENHQITENKEDAKE